MVNLNWDQLRAVNVDEIGEEEVSQIYQQLVEVDVADENDVLKLKLLFRVTQAVMQAKAVQAEIALDELEQLAEKSGSSKTKQELQDKIDQLNKQIKKFKAQAGNVTKDNNEDEAEDIKNEIERMRAELHEKDRQLSLEKRETERFATRMEELDRERKDLTKEISHLNDEIEEYRRQLDDQNDSSHQKSNRDQEFSIKVREKNQQINKLLEDIESAEVQGAQLQQQVIELRDKLQESTKQMDKMTADYIQLKNAVKQSENLVDNLREENQALKLQISDLAHQNQARIAADDEIIAAVNQRVEEWKSVLSGKEALIITLQNEVKQLRESLAVSGSISNKTSINILSKAVEDRDKQITILKQELEKATKELEESASFIEKLKIEKSSGSANEWQLKQIESLQTRLSHTEKRESEMKHKCEEAEHYAQVKDKELTLALARIKQYELGEYGLHEAVLEIKSYKQQLHLRDQQIEELNTIVNHTELALTELKEVNEDLYEQLGIDPQVLEYSEIQNRIAEKHQREKSLNRILQSEVDNLEEERLFLKQEIRKLAQIVGQRASHYGLTSEDAITLQNFAEQLSNKNSTNIIIDREASQTKIILNEVTQQMKHLQHDLNETRKKLLHPPSGSLEFKQVEIQPSVADSEVYELLKAFKRHCSETDIASQVISLKKLLQFFSSADEGDEKNVMIYLQSEVENLIRVKEKLESDLIEAKKDTEKVQNDLIITKAKVEELESELLQFRNVDKMCNSFDELDAVAKVNSFIAFYLKKLESSATSRHESHLSNSENGIKVLEEKLNVEISDLKKENEFLEVKRAENDLKASEHERLLSIMSSSDDTIKKEIADMNRKLIVAKVNETKLIRKCSYLLEQEVQSRRQGIQLQNEILGIQGAVLHRVNYLEQFKEIAIFKIAALYRALEHSIPAFELNLVNQQNNELMEKYQQLLQKDREILSNVENLKIIESDSNELLKSELQSSLEKLHLLEYTTHSEGSATDASKLCKTAGASTIKDSNERPDTVLAPNVTGDHHHKISKLLFKHYEELEKKCVDFAKLNLKLQQTVKELQLELEVCVSKQEYDRVCTLLENNSAREILLKKELIQMKEIVEVAENQVSSIEILYAGKLKGVEALEKHLLDVQSESDDKTVIGKLYRQLVTCQISEAQTQHKLEKCHQQLQKIEALSLRLEQKCDEKDHLLYHVRNEAQLKANRLKRIIQGLRNHSNDTTVLFKQQDIVNDMVEILSDKLKMQKELDEARSLLYIVREKLKEFDEKNKCLDELISAMKDGRETQKVLEWHNKIMELKLLELKKYQQIEKLGRDLEYKQKLIDKQEKIAASLKSKISHMEAIHDEQRLAWEAREFQLEKIIARLENQKMDSLSKVEVISSPLPDTSLPLAEQLDQALQTIKSNSSLLLENEQQKKDIRQETEFLKKRVQELEITIGAQEKVIAELRSKLSTINIEKTSPPQSLICEENLVDSDPALKVAQAVVESLKARLLQKEETISKYQTLLKKAREDLEDRTHNNQKEIEAVQAKIQAQTKNAMIRFQHEVQQNFYKPQSSSQIAEQITKMNELQEIAIQQDSAISILTEKLKASSKEIQHWQLKVEATAKELLQDKEKLQEEYERAIQKLQHEADAYREESVKKENELENVKKDLEKQIDVNRKAPSVAMKNIIEKMRQQLHTKEKQIQALSNALAELKNDMKAMVEDNALQRSTSIDQVDIQALIGKQTAMLQEKLNAITAENEHLKRSLKKDDISKKELLKNKEEFEKQTALVSELLKEKQHFQQVIQDLESKIKRISRMEERDILEVNVLQSKIKELEEKLAAQQPAEKPYDSMKENVHISAKTLALETWEEAKKYQQLVTKLKSKLNEKEIENSTLEKSITTMKNVISRLEKEKMTFERKTKTTALKEFSQPESHSAAFQQLYSRHCILQDELMMLKRQLFVEKDLVIEELTKKNELLADKNDELNQKMRSYSSASSPKKVSVTLVEELNKYRDKEENLQKEVLKLSQENLELQFDIQKVKADLPIYMDRVKQLEKCIELIRSEKNMEQQEVPNSPRRASVGMRSKSTAELEKTIGALKKVIEKLQAESEKLKRRLQDTNKNTQLLEEENKTLKERLVSTSHGAPHLHDSLEKRSAKIVAHNERLLRDLQKEVKTNEVLRVQLHEYKSENEKLQKNCNDLQRTLDNLESQHPNLTHLGGQRWKAEAISRLYEEKLKTAESELHKQTQMVVQLKALLNEAILIEDEYVKIAGTPQKVNENRSIRNRFINLQKFNTE